VDWPRVDWPGSVLLFGVDACPSNSIWSGSCPLHCPEPLAREDFASHLCPSCERD
jgi:hypothetical protein